MSLSHRIQARRLKKWRDFAIWHRIRYDDPAGVTNALALFSRRKARVELFFRADNGIAVLFAGLPAAHAAMFREMAHDFGFSAAAVDAPEDLPIVPLEPVRSISYGLGSWLAHIVDGELSISTPDKTGNLFPSNGARQWRLPSTAPPGVCASSTWRTDQTATADQPQTPLQASEWVLGLTSQRTRLTAQGHVRLYGAQVATTGWLADSLTPHFAAGTHGGLIVIDGTGRLASRLKRRRQIVRLLRDSVRYIDMRDVSARGFNPLTVLPGEDRDVTLRRWKAWWRALKVNERGGLMLLPKAYDAGVRTVFHLQQWLKDQRTARYDEVAPFLRTVQSLIESDLWDDWLAQPVDLFDDIGNHALVFACVPSRWETRALLRSVLLAAFNLSNVRIVAHGIQWNQPLERHLLSSVNGSVATLVSNAPLDTTATPVLTACPAEAVGKLATRFGAGDPVFAENLSLLQEGESVVLRGGQPVFARWRVL